MKYQDLGKYYLCGISDSKGIYDFRVGTYNKDRDSFSFTNGSYNNTEIYKYPSGNSSTYVKSAIPLQEIDDAELLYKYENNV